MIQRSASSALSFCSAGLGLAHDLDFAAVAGVEEDVLRALAAFGADRHRADGVGEAGFARARGDDGDPRRRGERQSLACGDGELGARRREDGEVALVHQGQRGEEVGGGICRGCRRSRALRRRRARSKLQCVHGFRGEEVPEGNGAVARGDGHLKLNDLIGVVAALAVVADAHRIPQRALDGKGHGHAAERGLDGFHDLFAGEAEAGEFPRVEADLRVGFAAFALHLYVGGAGRALDDLLGGLGATLPRVGIVALHLQGDQAADAGGEHDDARLDRLEPARGDAGDVGEGGKGGADLGEGARALLHAAVGRGDFVGRPLGVGLEEDDGLDHADRRGIEGGLGASHFSHDAGHFGHGLDQAVLREHDALRLAESAGGGNGRHEEQAALVEGRKKTGADAGKPAGERAIEGRGREIGASGGEGEAEGPAEGGPAGAEQVAAERQGGDGEREEDLVPLDVAVGPFVGDVDGVARGVFLVVDQALAAEAPHGQRGDRADERCEEPAGERERPAAVLQRQAPAVVQEPAEGAAAGEPGQGDENGPAHLPGWKQQPAEHRHEQHPAQHGAADRERFGDRERGRAARTAGPPDPGARKSGGSRSRSSRPR